MPQEAILSSGWFPLQIPGSADRKRQPARPSSPPHLSWALGGTGHFFLCPPVHGAHLLPLLQGQVGRAQNAHATEDPSQYWVAEVLPDWVEQFLGLEAPDLGKLLVEQGRFLLWAQGGQGSVDGEGMGGGGQKGQGFQEQDFLPLGPGARNWGGLCPRGSWSRNWGKRGSGRRGRTDRDEPRQKQKEEGSEQRAPLAKTLSCWPGPALPCAGTGSPWSQPRPSRSWRGADHAPGTALRRPPPV